MHSLIVVFESLTFPVVVLSCLSLFLLVCCIYGTRHAYKIGVRDGYEFASAPLNPDYDEASKVLNISALDAWQNLNDSKVIIQKPLVDFEKTQFEEILPDISNVKPMSAGLTTVAKFNKQPAYKEKRKPLSPLLLIKTLSGFNKQTNFKEKQRVLDALSAINTRRTGKETL